MRKMRIVCCVLLVAFSWGTRTHAQEAAKSTQAAEAAKSPEPPVHFYHLEFVVQELGGDGKTTNSRTYSGTVSTSRTDRGFSMRTGSRVPVLTGVPSEENKNASFQYIDVGVSIDARDAHETGGKLALSLNADISSLAGTQNINGVNEPVVRQNKWQAEALIPIGKPTVVFTSDVLDSKGGMQLSVTSTRLE